MSGHFWGAVIALVASALGWAVWFCASEPAWAIETQLPPCPPETVCIALTADGGWARYGAAP